MVCGACHPTSLVNALRSAAEWDQTVDLMASLGAKGTDEQFDRVMRFLLRNLTQVNVNTATAPELALVLDVSNAAASAVVKYRGQNGKFKALEELKKVPGLNAAKRDARRDRIRV
jgi:competence protein ComEA